MNDEHDTVDRQRHALLDLVAQFKISGCLALTTQAEQEAVDIIRDAHRQARARMHQAVIEERERASQALRGARAQVETDLRNKRLKDSLELARRGRALMEEALLARWQDAGTRQQWIDALCRRATAALPAGAWEVEHPPAWERSELSTVREASFRLDATIRAGLRIGAGGARVDGTLDGLLADREEIDAMLLAFLEKDTSKP